jgi:hypothetical protein
VSQDIQVPAGDKLIFKKSIEMYFGSPTSDELMEKLNKRAIEWNLSVEAILLGEFEHICNSMQKKRVLKFEEKDYNLNGFDSHCVVHADAEGVFFSPPVEFGKYSHNGSTYPKLILKDGYLRNQCKRKEFPLTDSIIDKLGRGYEQSFNFEFIGFERVARVED